MPADSRYPPAALAYPPHFPAEDPSSTPHPAHPPTPPLDICQTHQSRSRSAADILHQYCVDPSPVRRPVPTPRWTVGDGSRTRHRPPNANPKRGLSPPSNTPVWHTRRNTETASNVHLAADARIEPVADVVAALISCAAASSDVGSGCNFGVVRRAMDAAFLCCAAGNATKHLRPSVKTPPHPPPRQEVSVARRTPTYDLR